MKNLFSSKLYIIVCIGVLALGYWGYNTYSRHHWQSTYAVPSSSSSNNEEENFSSNKNEQDNTPKQTNMVQEKQTREITCPNCKGTGTAKDICDRCDYNSDCDQQKAGGYIRVTYGLPKAENCRQCPRCKGSGYVVETCKVCDGTGKVTE